MHEKTKFRRAFHAENNEGDNMDPRSVKTGAETQQPDLAASWIHRMRMACPSTHRRKRSGLLRPLTCGSG
jgi:hypothetical protein